MQIRIVNAAKTNAAASLARGNNAGVAHAQIRLRDCHDSNKDATERLAKQITDRQVAAQILRKGSVRSSVLPGHNSGDPTRPNQGRNASPAISSNDAAARSRVEPDARTKARSKVDQRSSGTRRHKAGCMAQHGAG